MASRPSNIKHEWQTPVWTRHFPYKRYHQSSLEVELTLVAPYPFICCSSSLSSH
jgi:hypothetical protein